MDFRLVGLIMTLVSAVVAIVAYLYGCCEKKEKKKLDGGTLAFNHGPIEVKANAPPTKFLKEEEEELVLTRKQISEIEKSKVDGTGKWWVAETSGVPIPRNGGPDPMISSRNAHERVKAGGPSYGPKNLPPYRRCDHKCLAGGSAAASCSIVGLAAAVIGIRRLRRRRDLRNSRNCAEKPTSRRNKRATAKSRLGMEETISSRILQEESV